MSDFTSNFWSVYVAGITVLSISACLLLLWFSGKARAMTAHDNTTGHVWDGDLREMNNPLPRWWVGLFLITILFAAVYLYLYPGLGARPKWPRAMPRWHRSMPSSWPCRFPMWPRIRRPMRLVSVCS